MQSYIHSHVAHFTVGCMDGNITQLARLILFLENRRRQGQVQEDAEEGKRV